MRTSTVLRTLGLLIFAHVALASEYPITITCQDELNAPYPKIFVGVSPANNQAFLSYQSETMTSPVRMVIEASSFNSASAFVTITSNSGATSGLKSIKIDTRESEIFRATTFSQFSLELKENRAGNFVLEKLNYAKGVVEYPDSQVDQEIVFDSLPCSLSGL